MRSFEIQDRSPGRPVLVYLANGDWCGERLCEDTDEAKRLGRAWEKTGRVITWAVTR